MSKYVRTSLATDWPAPEMSRLGRLRSALSKRVVANPDYEDAMYLVFEWLVEFDDDNRPWREIGLDSSGQVVLSGPNETNYGFWLDTNMTFKDFDGVEITSE
ncbi:MAG: hypothetical protein AAGH76_14975 [Pseudomonadota bacterium]